MSNPKPKGMRIGESVFCVGYLLFVLVAGLIFLSQRGGSHGAYAAICAMMTLLLGGGDAFHLVPRILHNIQGEPRNSDDEHRRHFWLGLGNLVSSITMTVFYIFLFDAMQLMPGAPAVAPQAIRVVLLALAAVRIALCLFPHNHWFNGAGSQEWGIYRNLPFVAMGILTVFYLLAWYHAWMLAFLVTASFACYLGVVLFAKEKPMMGMLMIPKTICYIWMITIFLGAL